MELKTYFAQDAAGNIISSAIVNVFLQGTTTLATGLTRADGTPLENPFAADGAGRIQFRAPDGYYDVQVSAGPGIIQTLTIQCVDYSGAKADADRAEEAAEQAELSAEQVADAIALRSDLAQPGGASIVKTSSGDSVQNEIDGLGLRIDGRNTEDGNIIQALNDIELAYNALGATLQGNEVFRVDFTAAQTDTASRLVYALQQVPSGYVFERLIAFGSEYCTMSIRQVNSRQTVGKPSIVYNANTYQGQTIYTAVVKGRYINNMRMAYVDGTTRTPAEWLTYLNIRFVRLLTNASPVGDSSTFCTTINNGKLIQGDPNNTYFTSSCFFLADGKLEVVPHKDTPVEQVVKNYYYNHDAVQAMHFKYVLVKDGAVYDLVSNGYTTPAGWETILSGRTSIGQKENGDLVLAVVDGNTTAGTGISVKGMAEYMLSQGCVNAMNLDGSGSSTMYYNNARVNSPSDGKERKMVNVIYFI